MPAHAPTVSRVATPSFLFLCWDAPGADALRARDLDGHLAHVEKNWRKYLIAGPMREPGGERLIGSLFLVLASDITQAWDLCRADPYFRNGQYATIEVKHFTPSIGLAIGGKIWENAEAIRARAAGGPPDGPSA